VESVFISCVVPRDGIITYFLLANDTSWDYSIRHGSDVFCPPRCARTGVCLIG